MNSVPSRGSKSGEKAFCIIPAGSLMIRKRPRGGSWILGQASEFIRKSFNRGKAMTPQRKREGFQVEIN